MRRALVMDARRRAFLGGYAILTFAATQAMAAAAPAPRAATIAEAGYEDDADGFVAARIRVGALLDYASDLKYAGLSLQNTNFSSIGWNTDVPALIGMYRNQDRDTLLGVRAEGGLVHVNGHTRPVGDATWGFRAGNSTGIELTVAGDLVGTQNALEEGIAYSLAGVSLEQAFGTRLTGIAMTALQPFTDGNTRTVVRARMIWSMLPEQGVSAQVRWRQYSSGESDVPGAYFNPERYRTWDAVLSMRRRVGPWRVAALIGTGQERIADGEWQSTGVAELRAEGPVGRSARLSCSATYSNAAGFATASDYWYGSFNVSLIVPIGR